MHGRRPRDRAGPVRTRPLRRVRGPAREGKLPDVPAGCGVDDEGVFLSFVYVLLAATALRAVTSRSCEVVSYSRATRGDENARAGRGEDARGGEVRAAGCFALGLTRRARIVTLAHAGPATVGARPDGEAEDEDELHGLLALCGNQPVIGCGESPATTRPSSTPPRRRRRKTAAPAPTQTWAPRRWRGGRRILTRRVTVK